MSSIWRCGEKRSKESSVKPLSPLQCYDGYNSLKRKRGSDLTWHVLYLNIIKTESKFNVRYLLSFKFELNLLVYYYKITWISYEQLFTTAKLISQTQTLSFVSGFSKVRAKFEYIDNLILEHNTRLRWITFDTSESLNPQEATIMNIFSRIDLSYVDKWNTFKLFRV